MSEPSPKLNKAFRLLYWEGALAMVYDAWTGPTYLSGLAGELGAPVFWVSLLCSAAWIGAVGQLVGAWAYERVPSYKQYTVALAAASRGLWLLPLIFAAFWLHRQRAYGEAFPIARFCAVISLVACGAALLGASSAAAWSSWMRALVPDGLRGRFFGTRHRYVMIALTLANLAASFCVGWRPAGLFVGFALIGGLAVLLAGASTVLLSRVEDAGRRETPAPSRKPGDRAGFSAVTALRPAHAVGFVQWVRAPLKDPAFRGVVVFGAVFNGAMQLASPYFPYYFTHELGFSMGQVALWTMLTNVGCLLAAARWGARVDRQSEHPRAIMRAMGTLVALSPAYYILGGAEWIRFVAPLDYFTNGAIWCGYWLALTTLLFRSIPRGSSPALCFSIYTASAGLCGALGSFAGGWLAEALAPWGGFRALWVIAALARLSVAWGLYGLLKPSTSTRAAETATPAAEPIPALATGEAG